MFLGSVSDFFSQGRGWERACLIHKPPTGLLGPVTTQAHREAASPGPGQVSSWEFTLQI